MAPGQRVAVRVPPELPLTGTLVEITLHRATIEMDMPLTFPRGTPCTLCIRSAIGGEVLELGAFAAHDCGERRLVLRLRSVSRVEHGELRRYINEYSLKRLVQPLSSDPEIPC